MISIALTFSGKDGYSAVAQILNSYFFQNPAELSQIKQVQFIGGNLYMIPKFEFTGVTAQGFGKATSETNNSIPYLLSAYRFTDRFVLGVNVTPSVYGHLAWPMDSIVAQSSTVTNFLYYRIGAQSSYQLTEKLAVGLGLHLEYNKLAELDMVLPNLGNQINKISGLNHSMSLGVFYKINPQNYFTMAMYTPVNTYGHGSSSLGPLTVNNFYLNIIQASVAYIGFQHFITDKWFVEEKIYWSGWSIEKKVNFINKTNGNSTSLANWKDVWSFQISSRYKVTDKVALLGSIIYETNPVPTITNQIGYPLSASGAISGGFDLTLTKGFSAQLIYGYGKYIPNAKINTSNSKGSISANFQTAGLQLTYRA